jgi:hypothetical protein
MKHATFGLILITLSLLFNSSVEILEASSFDFYPIIFSISKTLILIFIDCLIIISIKKSNPDCLFIGTLINLIYSCLLFLTHLLLEINKPKYTTEYYLVIVLNILSVFSAFFASIFLFLLHKEMKNKDKSKFF